MKPLAPTADTAAEREAKLSDVVAVSNRKIELLQAQLAEARAVNERLNAAREKDLQEEAWQRRQDCELLDMLEAYRAQRDEAKAELKQCEKKLRRALQLIEEMEMAQSQSQRRAVLGPSAQHSQATASYSRRVEELEGQLAQMHHANSALHEQVERLAAANNSLKQTTATAQQERERADDQRTKLHAAYASLREELDRYQSGFYRDVLAGAGQVAGVVLRSVAAARGIKLPSPETAAAVPAPAPPKTSKAAPPAKAADVRRWRKLVDEQEQRGWIPEQDHLVLAMREQIITEDELATAQAKHGMRVTAHRLPADADLTLLASYAALTARMEHFKKESKNQDYFRRSTWVHESYLLDSLSEISLQEAAINRRLELDSLARNLQYRRR